MQLQKELARTSNHVRTTWAEINLSRLLRNLRTIRSHVEPAKVMIIVKANAYGHGSVEVSKFLAPHVDYFGVAVLEEGIHLRKAGIDTPILVLGGIWGNQIPQYIKHNLTLTAPSVERLEQIEEAARKLGIPAKVQIKIDTGMERIGVHYYNAETILEASQKCKHVHVEGIFSHFANADGSDLSYTHMQLERFCEVLRFYERNSLPVPTRHMANSAAILRMPDCIFDMVRPGIMVYGVYPYQNPSYPIIVEPVLSWKSRVVYFKVIKAGHPVSYGSTWQSDDPVRLVTLPVGYGDGYFRSLSNKVKVIIRGKKYQQVGAICMDQMMVNIENDSAFNGDEVILVGESAGNKITIPELAEWAGTIPYEVLTNINTRVPRLYFLEE
jgi:alanine racemase